MAASTRQPLMTARPPEPPPPAEPPPGHHPSRHERVLSPAPAAPVPPRASTIDMRLRVVLMVMEQGSENDRRSPLPIAKAIVRGLSDPDWDAEPPPVPAMVEADLFHVKQQNAEPGLDDPAAPPYPAGA